MARKKTSESPTPSKPAPAKKSRKISSGALRPSSKAETTSNNSQIATATLQRLGCGVSQFSGDANAAYDRHLKLDHVVDPKSATIANDSRRWRTPFATYLHPRWLKTQETYDRENPKRVYYLSMEFLLGRSLSNNIANLRVEPLVRDLIEREGLDLNRLIEEEPDAGLGNGGLGRLAACYIDSLATLQIPADRIRPALRVRHVPAGDCKTAIRSSTQTTGCASPIPGRSTRPAETVEARINCGPAVPGRIPVCRRPGRDAPGRSLRPARRRLRRPDHQHAAALGSGLAGLLRSGRIQPRRFLRSSPRQGPGREPDPRPLPGDSTSAGRHLRFFRSTSWSPARWPTSCADSAATITTGTPCPTRSRSSSTTRTRRWRSRS